MTLYKLRHGLEAGIESVRIGTTCEILRENEGIASSANDLLEKKDALNKKCSYPQH